MENHEDIPLRSGGEVEDLNEVEEVEESQLLQNRKRRIKKLKQFRRSVLSHLCKRSCQVKTYHTFLKWKSP